MLHYFSDPPGPPVISGYVKGSHVYEGTKHQLTCTSSGGNPLADLTWHRNDEQVTIFFYNFVTYKCSLFTYFIICGIYVSEYKSDKN